MSVKEQEERMSSLIAETLLVLCKSGLDYKTTFRINALIGITLDENEVLLVDIKETVGENGKPSFTCTSSPYKVLPEAPESSQGSDHSNHSRRKKRKASTPIRCSPAPYAKQRKEEDADEDSFDADDVQDSQLSLDSFGPGTIPGHSFHNSDQDLDDSFAQRTVSLNFSNFQYNDRDQDSSQLRDDSLTDAESTPGPCRGIGGSCQYRRYSKEDFNMAIEGVRTGKLSVSEAGRIYGIPRTTLRTALHNKGIAIPYSKPVVKPSNVTLEVAKDQCTKALLDNHVFDEKVIHKAVRCVIFSKKSVHTSAQIFSLPVEVLKYEVQRRKDDFKKLIREAVDAVNSGTVNVDEAAKFYEIPRAELARRCKKVIIMAPDNQATGEVNPNSKLITSSDNINQATGEVNWNSEVITSSDNGNQATDDVNTNSKIIVFPEHIKQATGEVKSFSALPTQP